MPFAFAPSPPPAAAIAGSATRFPVRRIFCIGRNYAEHAAEMGASIDRGNPVFFCKPADAIVVDGADVPYPQATKELHHEVEMVVALHSGGIDIAEADALTHVFGYAVGLDLTRRDLQAIAKAKGMPWDTAKAFDHSAPLSPIRPAAEIGHPRSAALTLAVNGQLRQQSDIAQMIFNVPEMLARLSRLFELKAGDLVFTGTPEGVGPLVRGDAVHAQLAGLTELRCRIA